MPLYVYLCGASHESMWLGSYSALPATVPCEKCGEPSTYDVVATGRPYRKEPAVDGNELRVKGEAPRFGLLTYVCARCNVTFKEVLPREEQDYAREHGRPCPECSLPATWVPSWNVDRFAERIQTNGGSYYDRGLGMRIRSPAHRRDVCRERGLTPVDGDWDVDRMFRKQDDEREREEREYAAYLDRVENHPVFAQARRARDLGIL